MPQIQDFWVFILSPRELDSQRHMGPRLVVPWDLDSNLWRRESRSPALRVEVPCAASRGPLWRRESRSLGTK